MITPRTTRLLRVPDLQAMHLAIAGASGPDPAAARATAVLVPTRGAAEELRRTIEHIRLADGAAAVVPPECLTRAEFYERLSPPDRLSEAEREVIFRRAAIVASREGAEAPFRLRAGLIVEILSFYDGLRRRNRTVEAFERLMTGSLEPSAEIDRGAERLLRLTRFLAAAFREFERRIESTGRADEHSLRARVIESATPGPFTRVIVTVADQAADPRGLWNADYDLLSRMPGVTQLDVVATENVLASGFHQRLHDLLPGIEEERAGIPAPMPVLAAPDAVDGSEPLRWFVCRDREEELVEIARALKRSSQPPAPRTAVVFQRPLPYLYLARQVFQDAGLAYQAFDALPLAAEPFAAAVDLVLSFATSEGTRASIVDLLASPQWSFEVDGQRLQRHDVSAADRFLREVKHFGGWDRLTTLSSEATGRPAAALRAAEAAAAELRPLWSADTASAQIDALVGFIAAHEVLPVASEAWHARHLRGRAAILAALDALRDAHARHDDERVPIGELAAAIRRHIEGQTFAPRTGTTGLTLLDARAAPYADVDDVRIVGLVESDWPERGNRSIFYPLSLLKDLGWPSEADRSSAARARFHDLLLLAKRRVSASTFTLDEDAIVPGSPFLEELDGAGLPVERVPVPAPARMFVHEALAMPPVVPSAVEGEAADWLELRGSRSPGDANLFHGEAGAREAGVYAVSHVERYLECPFKYFAAYVLKLPEERDEQSGMTPQERGQFLHDVFETFFTRWQESAGGSITTANLAAALALFEQVAEAKLATLAEADRALERTHLLGSAAAPGLAERAFAFEIEQGGQVVERLLEHALEGEFVFQRPSGTRTVKLRAKADRIDLMADGTLRVVDYKLGKAPKPARALQLPVYGVCAEQHLEGRHGRSWKLARAGYVAFKEKNPFTVLGASSSLEQAVADGQERFLAALDGIEQGVFPPKPEEPFLCTWCGYASVCRKDYVGDE